MDAWHFTEMPYPYIPPHDQIDSMRVTLPNKLFDPKLGRELYNRYLDEYVIADELGAVRGSYSFNLFEQYRLDLFVDRALGRDRAFDRLSGCT